MPHPNLPRRATHRQPMPPLFIPDGVPGDLAAQGRPHRDPLIEIAGREAFEAGASALALGAFLIGFGLLATGMAG